MRTLGMQHRALNVNMRVSFPATCVVRTRSGRRRAYCLGLLILLSGCGKSGSSISPVSGTVTLDGKPIVEAKIIFQPEGGGGSPSYGFTDQNGRYELGYKRNVAGALVGWHTISIKLDTEVAGTNGESIHRPQLVPARYNERSELRREVKSGEDNEFEFELTSR